MRAPSDLRLLVMHGLRLKGFAGPEAVADLVALPESEVVPILDELVAQRLASHREGRVSGFSLTPAGRELHAAGLAAELDREAAGPAIRDAYARFLSLNTDLLTICTEWQLRDVDGRSAVNDHSDSAYDARVIGLLEALHAKAAPICEDLGMALDRFAAYGPRLGVALQKVRSGELDWFTKPMVASYHSLWFELHEDLLCTLGIERGTEGPG